MDRMTRRAEEQGGNARRSTIAAAVREINCIALFEISDSPVHMISPLPFCAPLLLRSSGQGIIAKTDTMDVLVLADDLTGALEAGARFAGCGIEARVTADTGLMETLAPVLVVDTETRHARPAEAARTIYALAREGRDRGARYLYKKTDSTLRGNIGSELGAALRASPGSPLLYVPAYPQMGSTVKGARLYVRGVPVAETGFASDTLNPIAESNILAVLSEQCRSPMFSVSVSELQALSPGAIYVCDGESDADVDAAARAFAGSNQLRLAAGPAAFAGAIAARVDLPRRRRAGFPRVAKALIVNGSLHETSLSQVRRAEACGFETVEPVWEDAPGWRILKVPAAGQESPLQRAKRAGELVRQILRETDFDALVVFGGDTAFGILDALGKPWILPIGEVLPGVPLAMLNLGTTRPMYLLTKAGGFGPVDVLEKLRRSLDKENGLGDQFLENDQ